MATVVLSAAGTAIGGPIGGAVGSFLGRQADQSFGRSAAPRLSDFRLPSAQYGDAIPSIRGRMRVSGTVLWCGAPVATATVGKSGSGPGSSVSFAYAFASGPIDAVHRIWADGRLIKDGAGRQAVTFTLRLHGGDEDQVSDPLIASALGDDQAPAFRGISYLVFENFDLSSFGNRLPLITVEIESTSGPALSAEQIIGDHLELGGGSSSAHLLEGYAATGDERTTAIAPLLEAFRPTFSHRSGAGWSLAQVPIHHVIPEEWWKADEAAETTSRFEGASQRPTKVSIRYFDPAIDYAAGEKSARLPGAERLQRFELPAAMNGETVKAAAFERLATAHRESSETWLTLPLSFARIQLGDLLSREAGPEQRLAVARVVFASGELRLLLRPASVLVAPMVAEAGSVVGAATLGRRPLRVALLDMPGDLVQSEPEVAVLVSGGAEPFEAMPVTIAVNGAQQEFLSSSAPAPFGRLLDPLEPGPTDLINRQQSIGVEFEQDPMLTSCDEAALCAGANIVWVGGEFLQFQTAEPRGNATYKLSGLIRGRHDSSATKVHAAGSTLLVLEQSALSKVRLPRENVGATLSAKVFGPDDTVAEAGTVVLGLAGRPWAPGHVDVVETQAGLEIRWVRRCKEGAAWLDGVNAPLGSSREAYALKLSDLQGHEIAIETAAPMAQVAAPTLSQLGPRPWRLELRQVGDFALSTPFIHFID